MTRCMILRNESESFLLNTHEEDRALPALNRSTSSWDRWWFREAPPHALALFRIIFGSFLLFYWSLYLPHVGVLFGNTGLAMPVADEGDGWSAWLLPFIETPSPGLAWVLFSLLLVSFACIAIGVFFRTACSAALLLHGYVWATSQHWFWFTMEQLSIIFLVILVWSGAQKTLSLHIKYRRGSWDAWEPISVLPQRLLALQITATFLGAGWLKMTMPDWQDGTIIVHSFMDRWATPLAFWVARLDLPMWMYDGFAVALRYFEASLPFGLWSPWWKWFLAGAAVFLITNALLLSFWWFLVLLPAYIVFFTPEKVAGHLHSVARAKSSQSIEAL